LSRATRDLHPFPTRRSSDLADASGRPRPVPVSGSEYAIAAGTVIVAIGQEVEIPAASVAQEGKGTAAVNGETLATSAAGIFAGGDRKSTRLNSSHVKISYAV